MTSASEVFVAAQLGMSVKRMRATHDARLARGADNEPELTDDYLARSTVCPACRLFHPIDDECTAQPRHCVG